MEEFEIVEEQAEKYAIQNYGTEDVVQSNLLQVISKTSFQDGAKWGIETICKKILEEVDKDIFIGDGTNVRLRKIINHEINNL